MTKEEFLQRAILTLLSNSDFTKTARNNSYAEESHAFKCAKEVVKIFDDNFYLPTEEDKDELLEERYLRIAKLLETIGLHLQNINTTLDKLLQNIELDFLTIASAKEERSKEENL